MSGNDERFGASSAGPGNAEAFAASLKRRAEAAKGLERDILTEVPMLYGSASGVGEHFPGVYGIPPEGDPGIVLARFHREELVRRNGGGIPPSSKLSGAKLPFERIMGVLALLYVLWQALRRY